MLPFNALQIPLINTAILLASGVTVTWAHYGLFENNYTQNILFFTVILGIYFTILQAYEYIKFFGPKTGQLLDLRWRNGTPLREQCNFFKVETPTWINLTSYGYTINYVWSLDLLHKEGRQGQNIASGKRRWNKILDSISRMFYFLNFRKINYFV